jgi:hypothetical protein
MGDFPWALLDDLLCAYCRAQPSRVPSDKRASNGCYLDHDDSESIVNGSFY